MNLLLLFLKIFAIAFAITAGIVALICGIYLLSCLVVVFVEFVNRKAGRK